MWPGQPMSAHWGLPDPSRAEGSEAERALAFADTHRMLNQRIGIFCNLPLASLDRLALQRHLDEIGRTRPRRLQRRREAMASSSLGRRLGAELLGSAFLLATVIGSGIMGERLAGGNVALALLGNTLPTGAMLVVLITMLGPISGAHFNPAVTAVFALRGEIARAEALALCRRAGRRSGARGDGGASHVRRERAAGLGQGARGPRAVVLPSGWRRSAWSLTILLTLRANAAAVATSVGLYITAAYWFTASTSFANPAVTLARAFSDTFAGIRPADVAPFVLAQLAGAVSALAVCRWLLAEYGKVADDVSRGAGS